MHNVCSKHSTWLKQQALWIKEKNEETSQNLRLEANGISRCIQIAGVLFDDDDDDGDDDVVDGDGDDEVDDDDDDNDDGEFSDVVDDDR